MESIKTDKPTLKKFGLTMALCFMVISFAIFVRHRHLAMSTVIVSLFFLLTAFGVPVALKYFYLVWMRLSFVLGWANTRLLLGVIFYLIFFPVGLLLRLFKKDLLDRKFQPDRSSYWKRRDKKEFSPQDYSRQF